MTPAERAWLSGLYEGEGYVGALPQGGFEMVIVSTDLDVLMRAWAICGLGLIREAPKAAPHHKDAWRWRVSIREEMIEFLTAIRPWLLERRAAKVDTTLAWYREHPRIRRARSRA